MKSVEKVCPFCNSENFDIVNLPIGESYVLTTVDTMAKPPSFNPTQGILINLYGCTDCGLMVMHNDTLSK